MRYQPAHRWEELDGRAPGRSAWAAVRRIVPTAGVALTLMGAAIAPAAAQTPPGEPADPEAARTQNQQRQQQVDSQLDTAKATSEQLQAELDRLDAEVRAGEAKAATARSVQAAAEKREAELTVEVRAAEAEVLATKREAEKQAVAAYMRPDRETASQVLAADDPQQFAKMRAMVGDIAVHHRSALLQRVEAENLLRGKKAEAETARAEATAAAQQAAAALAATTRARDARALVRAEIERRIVDLTAEQAALDAEEARLQAIIAERARIAEEARQRAEAEARARAEAEARAAAEAARIRGLPAPAPAPSASSGPVSGGGLIWPCAGSQTSSFGPRWGAMHKGIDIGAPTGTPIWAAADGEVIFAGGMGGYGNAVMISHANGLVTLYAHQSRIAVRDGQQVTRGQVIGYVGSTGHSTGPHLHFETRVNGVAQNPRNFL